MSRSNPTDSSQHPCTRWMEWDGEAGSLRYYDKVNKKMVAAGNKYTFILLDQLSCIKGWHDSSESGIYSNEVKDTRRDPFVVRAFKANGILAQGIYSQIRDKITSMGGKFHTNLYAACRDENGNMMIGSIMLKGAALREWTDFAKANRSEIFKKAIYINGCKEGQKGKVTFQTPVFQLKEITEESNQKATDLDIELQAYLKAYMSKPTAERAEDKGNDPEPEPDPEPRHPADDEPSEVEVPW